MARSGARWSGRIGGSRGRACSAGRSGKLYDLGIMTAEKRTFSAPHSRLQTPHSRNTIIHTIIPGCSRGETAFWGKTGHPPIVAPPYAYRGHPFSNNNPFCPSVVWSVSRDCVDYHVDYCVECYVPSCGVVIRSQIVRSVMLTYKVVLRFYEKCCARHMGAQK